MKKVISIVVLLVFLVCGFVGFSVLGDVNGSDKPGTQVTVEIPKGTGANAIGKILEDNGIIKNSLYFKVYVKMKLHRLQVDWKILQRKEK